MDRRFSVCKPTSKFRYLVQQVNEQCPLCDFTLKVGFWVNIFNKLYLKLLMSLLDAITHEILKHMSTSEGKLGVLQTCF